MSDQQHTLHPCYLRFESKEQAHQLLLEAGLVMRHEDPDDDSVFITASEKVGAFHESGKLRKGTGEFTQVEIFPDVFEQSEIMEDIPGWHAELILKEELPASLKPFEVFPSNPQLRFAGY